MRHRWKRGAAVLLTASMLFSNISITGLAEEDVATQAAEETQAETKPVETEAPTEKPTEAPTEAPTETPTEKPTEQTEKETESEKKTEKETEKETEAEGIYTVEEKNYTVTVEVPDDMNLPKGAELIADVVKKDSKEAKKDLVLAEKAAEGYEITGYQIYDLHFEKDNQKIELTAREKADIKVTIAIDKKEFDKDLKEKDLKVFHIRDLTDEEKKQAEEAALKKSEAESETESETESEADTDRIADKLKIKKTEEKDGKEEITFSTDGFSDYLFAVLKEKETEAQTEKQTESKTERQTEKETETQSTEKQTEEQEDISIVPQNQGITTVTSNDDAENPGEPQNPNNPQAPAEEKFTTLDLKVTGAEGAASTLIITADKEEDLTKVTDESKKIKITDASGKEISKATVKENVITIPVSGKESEIKIENLPFYKSSAQEEVKQQASYTVDAGGNYITEKEKRLEAEYYTVYEDADGKTVKNQQNGKVTLSADEKGMTLTVKNIYSVITVTSVGENAKSKNLTGMKYTVTSGTSGELTVSASEDKKGVTTVNGLPAGTYTIEGNTATIPGQYFEEKKSENVEITNDKPQGSVKLTYKPMTVTVKVVDDSNHPVSGVKVKIGQVVDKKYRFISGTTDSNGEVKKTGYIKRGETYRIVQTNIAGHYAAQSAQLNKNFRYTVNAKGENPSITFTNQATVVKIGVIDNVSATSPYAGSYVAGATVDIRSSDGTVLKTITTESQPVEVKGLLDPGVTYKVIQTEAPTGYIVGAPNASGINVVGTYVTLSASRRSERLIQISDDTVKVLISRKGYDSRTQVKKNGKNAYEYKNLKYLAGARLEIRDKDGNVVKDRNGNPISWTSDEKGGHLVEGVLASETEYTLVETTSPDGYDAAGKGVFHTYKSGNQAAVTMQTRKFNGTIRVIMRAAYQKTAIKVNGTFYCALFLDKDLKQRYIEAGVKPLVMSSNQVYAQVTFENIPAGTYYVAETDQKGNPLRDNATFKVSNPDQALNLTSNNKNLIAEITNDYVQKPADAQTVSKSELQNSYKSEYANYGGSASAASQLAAGGGNAVKTGDTTNVTWYVVLMIAALGMFTAVFVRRKKS